MRAALWLLCGAACGGRSDPDRPPLDSAVCAPAAGGFSTTLDNPFFPLAVGAVTVLEGSEDGAIVRVEIRALDETEVVAGVTTRVVEERESEGGQLVEVSRNFMVEAADGTTCYYGEDVDVYENGAVVIVDILERRGTRIFGQVGRVLRD